MNLIFKKLNFKAHTPVFVINAPDSFKKDMDEMASETEIRTTLSKAKKVSFVLAFVTRQKETHINSMTRSFAM